MAQTTEKAEGYCVRCRQKRQIKDPKVITFKNGKQGYSGTCVKCDTKMVRIIGKKKKDNENKTKE